MFELRVYGRRPSCLARYRHGGFTAIFPVSRRNVVDATAARTGTGDVVIADTAEGATVLPFPTPAERPARVKAGRPKARPKGRPKK